MNKILLIIEREFLSRVKKKSFLIMTVLGPILFAGITIIPTWLAMRDSTQTTVSVLDKSGLFAKQLKSNKETVFVSIDGSEDKAKQKLMEAGEHQMLLVISETNGNTTPDIRIFSESNPSLDLVHSIEGQINSELKNVQLKSSGIDPALVEKIKPEVDIKTTVLNDEGEKEGSSAAATIVGFGAGFLIYIFIFLYGSQVMTGVMEEKTNRVVEVIISSVRPFELMLGKIVGVAMVGLAQFLLWMILSYGITTVAGTIMASQTSKQQTIEVAGDPEASKEMKKKMGKSGILKELQNVNLVSVVMYFMFYFLGGYLLYSAMFAAVGAAVDNQQDAQQFMLPITIPIIGAIVMAQFIIKDPNSNLAFWMSVIPFTSPIIMMIRIPFEPPFWQILLSMVSLILGFLGTTWMAGKIYRVGILMYGKKVSYKELWKWMRY
jgi:ABC-2 type transport system permease protein